MGRILNRPYYFFCSFACLARDIPVFACGSAALGLTTKALSGPGIFLSYWHSREEFLDNNIELGNEL